MKMTQMARREDGATAILVSLLALFVLLPLVGLATSSIVRGGVQAELQMAADAGSLAGAASIPLGNFEDLSDDLVISPPPDPLQIACDQATSTLDANGLLGDISTTRPGLGDVVCEAEYLDVDIFLDEFGPCLEALAGSSPPLPEDPTGLLPTPAQISEALKRVLPGLLVPGVQVTLFRNVEGPLEPLISNAPTGDHVAESRARRRFKNVIVAPVVILPPPPSPIDEPPPEVPREIDPNDQLSQEEALEMYDDIVQELDAAGLLPAGCDPVFPALRDDFVDIFNPPEDGAPTSEDVLNAAATLDEEVLILVLTSGIPFFDFFPACIDQGPTDNFVAFLGCTTNAGGAFRASLIP